MLARLFSLGNKGRNWPAHRRSRDRAMAAFFIFLAVTFLMLVAQFGEDGVASWFQLQKQEARLAADVQKLENSNAEIEERLQGLAHDPQVLEKIAREEQNMLRPGEEVLTVLPARDGEI